MIRRMEYDYICRGDKIVNFLKMGIRVGVKYTAGAIKIGQKRKENPDMDASFSLTLYNFAILYMS